MSIEAMRQALEALELAHPRFGIATEKHKQAIDALRAAIEQAAEPVTTPRQWVELTDDEARALVNRATFGDRTNWQALVYMVDAKLKEKNHG